MNFEVEDFGNSEEARGICRRGLTTLNQPSFLRRRRLSLARLACRAERLLLEWFCTWLAEIKGLCIQRMQSCC